MMDVGKIFGFFGKEEPYMEDIWDLIHKNQYSDAVAICMKAGRKGWDMYFSIMVDGERDFALFYHTLALLLWGEPKELRRDMDSNYKEFSGKSTYLVELLVRDTCAPYTFEYDVSTHLADAYESLYSVYKKGQMASCFGKDAFNKYKACIIDVDGVLFFCYESIREVVRVQSIKDPTNNIILSPIIFINMYL
jgi:hypothetical protein